MRSGGREGRREKEGCVDMNEMVGLIVGLTVLGQVAFWATMFVAMPVFWVWMLVDSVLREEREYPGASSTEKLVWVLLIFFIQWPAVLYYFMVVRKIRRGGVPLQTATPATAA
jgi:hypothetical protein